MNTPDTLAGQLYLLGWDLDKRRLTHSTHRGLLLRAAALTDLLAAGLLREENGKPVPVHGSRPPADPLLAAVLAEVAESARPRSWRRWIGHHAGRADRIVRDRLAAERWVRVEPRRFLGIIPADRVTVRDTRVVR
ncbi:GOLPH3/VPS74 family protein, partial [Pseudonocardia pini]|uniref:GOLPH3/VPS74 family protein n=1 Tax=Pseudonocardia pini TaxID=2758030 RepID=UPI0015F10D2C